MKGRVPLCGALLAILALPVTARADAIAPGPHLATEDQALATLYGDRFSDGHDAQFEAVMADARRVVLWRYPGSGRVLSVKEGEEADRSKFLRFGPDLHYYTDGEGRLWCHVSYRGPEWRAWICLSDVGNADLPAEEAVVRAVNAYRYRPVVLAATAILVVRLRRRGPPRPSSF